MKKFALLAVLSALVLQTGFAFAQDAAVESTAVESTSADGPWTSSGNPVWLVTSFPFRMVTGAVGAVGGAVGGGLKGVVDTEQRFAANTFGKAKENPLMVPVGLVGTVVAVPVGLVTGAPPTALEYGKGGFHWWNRF